VVAEGAENPARHLAAGVPAKVRKELDGESARWVGTSWRHYVELGGEYLREHGPGEGR